MSAGGKGESPVKFPYELTMGKSWEFVSPVRKTEP
jgi:hypothetical protein